MNTHPTVRAAVIAVLLLATSLYLTRAMEAEAPPPRRVLDQLPLQLADWQGRRNAAFGDRILAELGVDDYVTRNYVRAGQPPIGLYVGYYLSQRQGDTMHSPMNCLPGSGWAPLQTSLLAVPVATEPKAITVKRVLIQKGLDRQLVLYWYQSHGRVIPSEYWGKIYTVVDALAMNRTDAALVRVTAPLSELSKEAEVAAEQRAVAFVQQLYPHLHAHIPK